MNKWALAFAVLILGGEAQAQQTGQFGAGVILGSPIGATAKYWLDGVRALDFGLGFSPGDSNFVFHGDFLWHDYGILPQPAQGKLGMYLAAGGRVHDANDAQFGIRMLGGISYWIPERPIELFGEAGPVFQLTGRTGVDVDGGVGVRFYFGSVAQK